MNRLNSYSLSVTAMLAFAGCRIEAHLPTDADDADMGAAGSPAVHPAAGSSEPQKPSSNAARSSEAAAKSRAAGSGGTPQRADDATPPPAADDWDDTQQIPAAAVGDGEVPGDLLGGWYASNGGTSIPFDPQTGEFGMQNGSGLYYRFAADGSYQKAFQSYASNAGCTTGFHAEESGSMRVSGETLALVPDGGEIHYRDNCSPSLDSDRPEDNLSTEQFTWELSAGGLRLTRSDGASSLFVRADD